MSMEGEVIVLTGASGCLGHHVLKLLIGREKSVDEIRCLDLCEPEESMRRIIDDELEKYNESHAERPKKVKWIFGDVRDINLVERTLRGADCVIHCASKIDVVQDHSEQDAQEMDSVNVGGTENLLKASVRLGVAKFIHVSSFEVYANFDTIYYATEATLPDTKWFLFGPSGTSKKAAEEKVKQFSQRKLTTISRSGEDSLNVIIVRFPPFYGESDKYFVSRILVATRFFGGVLKRIDNIWIRQQPIYVGNAAWSLIKANRRMETDSSISGEEFHITDETTIGDPFDFVEPFVEARGMQVSESSYPYFPVLFLLMIFFALRRYLKSVDIFGLFDNSKDRLKEAIERDQLIDDTHLSGGDPSKIRHKLKPKRWYDYVTLQTFGYMGSSNFLNRTKASLRLDYEPLFGAQKSLSSSLDWYKNHLQI